MNPERIVLLRMLEKMSKKYPDMRLGQLVANIASWTTSESKSVIWDVEDSDLIAACKRSLDNHEHRP